MNTIVIDNVDYAMLVIYGLEIFVEFAEHTMVGWVELISPRPRPIFYNVRDKHCHITNMIT